MESIVELISDAVRRECCIFSVHATLRLRQRHIMEWQAIAGMDRARHVATREIGDPHPIAEFELHLPDGTPVKAVWAWLSVSRVAKLVTVHFFPRMSS